MELSCRWRAPPPTLQKRVELRGLRWVLQPGPARSAGKLSPACQPQNRERHPPRACLLVRWLGPKLELKDSPAQKYPAPRGPWHPSVVAEADPVAARPQAAEGTGPAIASLRIPHRRCVPAIRGIRKPGISADFSAPAALQSTQTPPRGGQRRGGCARPRTRRAASSAGVVAWALLVPSLPVRPFSAPSFSVPFFLVLAAEVLSPTAWVQQPGSHQYAPPRSRCWGMQLARSQVRPHPQAAELLRRQLPGPPAQPAQPQHASRQFPPFRLASAGQKESAHRKRGARRKEARRHRAPALH